MTMAMNRKSSLPLSFRPGRGWFFATLLLAAANSIGADGTIENDALWYDTQGNEIWCNGGSMLRVEDRYYWVGQRTGSSTASGITLYSSSNLADWKYEGNPMAPADFSPHVSTGWMGRPGLLYNSATRKYVIVFEAESNKWSRHKAGFAVSDSVTGPYRFVRAEYGSDNISFGDQSVFQDGKDAYLVATLDLNGSINTGLGLYKLSPDYLSIESKVVQLNWPHREAAHIIKRNDLYFLFMSGTDYWNSTATRYSTAKSLGGPWSPETIVSTSPKSGDTYNSQHDFIIPVPGPDSLRWLYVGDRYSQFHKKGVGRAVFLPVSWSKDIPSLNWVKSWRIPVGNPSVISGKAPRHPVSHPDLQLVIRSSDRTWASSVLSIRTKEGEYSLKVVDFTGKEARSFSGRFAKSSAGPQIITWDGLSHKNGPIPPGIYLVQCRTSIGLGSGKLIIK